MSRLRLSLTVRFVGNAPSRLQNAAPATTSQLAQTNILYETSSLFMLKERMFFFLNSNYAHFEGENCVSGAATTRWRDDWSCEGMRRTRELKMSRHGLFHPLNSFCTVLFWVLVCFCVLFFLVWFYVVVYVQKDRRVPDGSITDPSLLLIAGIFPIHRR